MTLRPPPIPNIGLALRRARRRPGGTFAMVVMMTIGVGATTASFVAVDAVLLRDLPVLRQNALVVAWRASEITSLELPFSGTAFDAVARSAATVTDVAAYSAWGTLPILADAPD